MFRRFFRSSSGTLSCSKALSLGDTVFLANRGLFFPWPRMSLVQTASIVAALVAGLVWLIAARIARRRGRRLMSGRMAAAALTIFIFLVALPFVTAEYEVPVRKGLNFRGGGHITIEYMALLVGLTFYGAAYIAEIVRGGLNAVPLGQIEAARTLGLSPAAIFLLVRAPLALRLVIPPLSNQYLFLMKGTGLGIAVGFAELFQVTVTSINQTGKSIDFLVVMMLIYGAINFTISKLMLVANKQLSLRGSG
jgi:ABC-type amino acid transport system permease subunit